MNTHGKTGFYLTRDLMFSSRVTGVASQQNGTLRVVDSVEQLSQQTTDNPPAFVLIDLDLIAGNVSESVTKIREISNSDTVLIAYVGHVKTDLISQAKQTDIDTVMTRGQFNKSAADLLQELLN